MPAVPTITDDLIHQSLTNAVGKVCQTLLQQDATLVEVLSPEVYERTPQKYQLLGNVGFAGQANGITYLCMSDDFACFAVGLILGMSPAEVQFNGPELIKDAIGEFTNMTVGAFKNALCDVGYPCKLTLPTIARGRELSVAAIKGTSRYVLRYNCASHILVADLQLKTD